MSAILAIIGLIAFAMLIAMIVAVILIVAPSETFPVHRSSRDELTDDHSVP